MKQKIVFLIITIIVVTTTLILKNYGTTGNVSGRNRTECGYNLGLKYQCVEFIKRSVST